MLEVTLVTWRSHPDMISLGEELYPSPLQVLQAPQPCQPTCPVDPADTVIRFKKSLDLQLRHFELVINAAYEREAAVLSKEIDALRSQLGGTSTQAGFPSSKDIAQDAIHMSHWQEAPLSDLEVNFECRKPNIIFDLDDATREPSCEPAIIPQSEPPIFPESERYEIAFRSAGDPSSIKSPGDDPVMENQAMEKNEGAHDELGLEFVAPFDNAPKESFDSLEDKAQRRRERLQKDLQARLRSGWKLGHDKQDVPRWSVSSALTLSSAEWTDCPTNESISSGLAKSLRRNFRRQNAVGGSFSQKGCDFSQASFVLHPQSRFRVMFDMLGIAALVYDLFATPLLFFALPESTFSMAFTWFTRVFWTLELWLNFHTATYHKGIRLTKLSDNAKQYLKTSFIADFIIVLAEWSSFALEKRDARSLENLSLLRIAKVLRFLKIMRVFKLERIFHQFRTSTNSTLLVLCARPLFMLLFLLLVNHMIACLWYGIGKASNGWIIYQEGLDSSFGYMYATSFHWAVSQLHGNMEVFPTNLEERVFTSASAVFALILFSTFLSSITNGMMQIHALRAKRYELDARLREVLAKRNVSTGLTIAIKKRMDYIDSTRRLETQDEEGVLDALPADLLVDLHHEARRPVILFQNFFYILDKRSPRIIRKLCYDSMSESFYLPEQKVFAQGDACLGMVFVMSGTLKYEMKARRKNTMAVHAPDDYADFAAHSSALSVRSGQVCTSKEASLRSSGQLQSNKVAGNSSVISEAFFGSATVERGSWLSEAILWMVWECCGDLSSVGSSWMLVVDADGFAKVIHQFHWVHANACRYAEEFVERMVEQGVLTDLVPDNESVSRPTPWTFLQR